MTADVSTVSLDVAASDQYPKLAHAKWGGGVVEVRLGHGTWLRFRSLADFDAWQQALDRQRVAMGDQQTFGDAA